jgi:signal peptidase II
VTAIALLAGLAADAGTKVWAANALDDGRIIGLVGSLRLRLAHNTGIAFSIGSGRSPIFVAVGVAVTALIVWMATSATTKVQAAGFGFVLAGALGNLVDRMLGGSVIDFIDAAPWWPVFNVADISLFVGASLLVLSSFRVGDHESRDREAGAHA